MPTVQRKITVELSTEEVAKLLRQSLRLPDKAVVSFVIGHKSDPMDRYSTPFCQKVSFSYNEESELHTGSKMA